MAQPSGGARERPSSRELVRAFVARDFKSQYRRSLLGPTWAVLQPVAYTAMFVFLRGVIGSSGLGMDYTLFAFGGLVPWMFFSNAVVRATPSIRRNAAIVKKVALRREIFPAAAVVLSGLDLLISGLLLVLLVTIFGDGLGLQAFWALPLTAIMAGLAMAVGMITASVATYKWDIVYAIPFLMQFWLLASPVMYSRSEVTGVRLGIYDLNPMVGLLEGFRSVVVDGVAPDLGLLGLACLGTAVVYAVARPLFRSASQYFADVL